MPEREWADKDYYAVLGVKKVSHAYDVLSDPKTRKEYDDFRDMLASGFGGFGGFGGPGGPGGGTRRVRIEDLGDLGDIFTRASRSGGNIFDDDVFGSIFGGTVGGRAVRGTDLETEITLSFQEAL